MSNSNEIRNLYSIKPWASRLHGKVSAQKLREILESKLNKEHTLYINMAGVKEVTPGFAIECFGKLYLAASKQGCQIKFKSTPKEIKPVLRNAISQACKPAYERAKHLPDSTNPQA